MAEHNFIFPVEKKILFIEKNEFPANENFGYVHFEFFMTMGNIPSYMNFTAGSENFSEILEVNFC